MPYSRKVTDVVDSTTRAAELMARRFGELGGVPRAADLLEECAG